MGEQRDNVLVVTGTGGMGMAIARRVGPGHRLVLADRAADALRHAAEVLRDEGHDVTEVVADVSDRASVEALASTAAELGRLAAVVHTAGVSPVQASAEQVVAVDVVGTALILDAFLEHVVPGTVCVCIASMAGTFAVGALAPDVEAALATTPAAELAVLPALDPSALDPGMAYSFAKRANQLRVQAMSLPWGRRGGRVVSISPGVISTPMGRQELAGESGDFMRTMIETSGTGRVGTADDIAAAVTFLLSPQASFITGTDLLVDGGAVAGVRYGMG